ncbi:MAG TPA: four helix bundle protein [Candidatus Acidoferrum sp.]|jgi:four helix bundle protein
MAESLKSKPKTYRDLQVWQKAMDLVENCYQVSRSLPKDELFGLTSQIRRAAVSVPANIAEGFGRWHRKEYVHHLRMAAGSVTELETHLLIAGRLRYLQSDAVQYLLKATDEIGRMLNGLIKALSNP